MAISWLTAFKVIPWVDVIRAAPTVVRGARQLYSTVTNPTGEQGASRAVGGTEGRLQELETRVAELKREIAASSELIAALAEQNKRLVEAVEILRVRTRALLIICAFLAAFLLGLAARMLWA
jgi:hypothetical protein